VSCCGLSFVKDERSDWQEPQISPLRCAPVEMTILFEDRITRFHERSAALQIPTLAGAPGRKLERSGPGWRSFAMKLSPIHLPAAGNVERIEAMTTETKAGRLNIAR
jgi:hypothetical protein